MAGLSTFQHLSTISIYVKFLMRPPSSPPPFSQSIPFHPMTPFFSLPFTPWPKDLLLLSLGNTLLGIGIPGVILKLTWILVYKSCLESNSVWLTESP